MQIELTATFKKAAAAIWSPAQLDDLFAHLLANPEAGDVVPKSGGVRKLRWSRPGMGKRGGARVIYYVKTAKGEIWMLTAYTKAKMDNIPADVLAKLRETIE